MRLLTFILLILSSYVTSKALKSAVNLNTRKESEFKIKDDETEETTVPIPEELFYLIQPITEYYFKLMRNYMVMQQKFSNEQGVDQEEKVKKNSNQMSNKLPYHTANKAEERNTLKVKQVGKPLFDAVISPIEKYFMKQINDILPLGMKLYGVNNKRLATRTKKKGVGRFVFPIEGNLDGCLKCVENWGERYCSTCVLTHLVHCCTQPY